jgi:colicin import membrane protein
LNDTALTTITEYSPTAQGLAELRQRLGAMVYDVTTGKGMDEAKKDRAIARSLRTNLETLRTQIKAPALERCRAIDAEAKRLTAEIEELEKPIDAQIKAEENRKALEKAAKEQAERDRITAINARFDSVKGFPLKAVGKTYAEIEALIEEVEQTDTAFEGQDAAPNEAAMKHEVRLAVAHLRASLDARWLADKEADEIAAKLKELDELREKAAAQQRELDRLAQIERDRQAEEARQAEDAARAARAAAEAIERQARQEAEAKAEAERVERQRAEDAERAKAAKKLKEDQAKAKAERDRLAKAAIAGATLESAAREALALLEAVGYAEHLTTLKLAAALAKGA